MSPAAPPTRLPEGRWSSRRITHHSRDWPALLDEIADPPSALYVDGREIDLSPASVAIVGTRRPTAAGLEAARRFATGLASAGFVVVSGLAVGIDAVAHQAALDANGRTIAVVGCGLDVDYPSRNRNLRYLVREHGSLVGEHEPGVAPQPFHFPRRNRIIAGISNAVVVVEGGLASGALITARLALESNRSIFAVPGSIRNPMAEGPNRLLEENVASAAPNVQTVLDDLAPALVYPSQSSQAPPSDLAENELTILSFLDDAPTSLQDLARESDLPPGPLGLAISKLEVRGLAARRPGGYEITTRGANLRACLSTAGEDEE